VLVRERAVNIVDASRGRQRIPLQQPRVRRWLILWLWLIVLGLMVGGVIGLIEGKGATPLYQAQAVVVASTTQISDSSFGDVAQAAFGTDEVLQPVIDRFGLATTAHALVADGTLAAQPIAGSAGIKIIAQEADPQLAAELANAATSSFIGVAESKGLGTFVQFGTRVPTGTRVPRPVRKSTLTGALAGGAVALMIVLLLLVIRPPVLGEEDALAELPSDASFTARVRTKPRLPLLPWKRGLVEVHPRGLAWAVWRAAQSEGADGLASICCVMVRRGRRDRALRRVLEELRAQRPADPANGADDDPPCFGARDPELLPALAEATSVVTLVADRAPQRVLRRLDEDLRVAAGGELRVLVYVT
jgi:capsular polysaccharide biosynthesis protein